MRVVLAVASAAVFATLTGLGAQPRAGVGGQVTSQAGVPMAGVVMRLIGPNLQISRFTLGPQGLEAILQVKNRF